MVSGKYFNKGVNALNDPNVGFVLGRLQTRL